MKKVAMVKHHANLSCAVFISMVLSRVDLHMNCGADAEKHSASR